MLTSHCLVSERRSGPNRVGSLALSSDPGPIQDSTCILIDDLIDTGGSLLRAAELLRGYGAHRIVALGTHPIFSWNAIDLFRSSFGKDGRRLVDEILVTDTLPLRRALGCADNKIVDS